MYKIRTFVYPIGRLNRIGKEARRFREMEFSRKKSVYIVACFAFILLIVIGVIKCRKNLQNKLADTVVFGQKVSQPTDVIEENDVDTDSNKRIEDKKTPPVSKIEVNSLKETPPPTLIAGFQTIPENTCFTVSYKHKPADGHKNIDDCSTHKNVIDFKPNKIHPDISSKNVCIRVDETPVKFETIKSKWIIGPIAGPSSVISVRYCPAKIIQDCNVPKDSFMDAIGGEQENDAKTINWDGSKDANKDIEVDSELGSEIYPEGTDSSGLTLFDGWTESFTKTEVVVKSKK